MLKIILILLPFIFVLIKGRALLARDKRFFVLIAGFVFVTLGFVVDFTGDFLVLEDIPNFLRGLWLHREVIEDAFGTAGFLLFILGIVAEVSHMDSLNRENTQLIERLNESKKKLEKLNEMKSLFVATVSHELRTTLSTSRLALENFKEEVKARLEAGQEKTLEVVHSSLCRLSRIVEDLLDLAKIEAGKMELRRELFDLSQVAAEVVLSQRPKAEAVKVTIIEEHKKNLPLVWGDKDKIIQVILNILSNALKFTPAGGRITLRTTLANRIDGVCIEVSDTGPGILPEMKEKIFERFESENIACRSSAGLGLSISKEIVELHQGRIWFESESGRGTTFIIQLPRDLRR